MFGKLGSVREQVTPSSQSTKVDFVMFVAVTLVAGQTNRTCQWIPRTP